MAERKTRAGRTTRGRRAGAARRRPDALGRLNDSMEATQAALKDLRSEMSRGSRDLLKDVDKTLRDARKNLRRTSRRIAKDLDEVQQAARGKRATSARGKRASTARKASSGRRAQRRGSTGRSGRAKK
jgi:ABC-type transporter Mla subunit MlaD